MSLISALTDPIKKLSTITTDWVSHIGQKKSVYEFEEGNAEDRALLGSKGAGLCEMTRLGLPVPAGFIVSTEACAEYFRQSNELEILISENSFESKADLGLSKNVWEECCRALKKLEQKTGRCFGGSAPAGDTKCSMPLLLSVRSGSAVSMPGMMDTILNLGINDEIVTLIAAATRNTHFALDVHRRFLRSFGVVVLGVDKSRYDNIVDSVLKSKGRQEGSGFDVADLTLIITAFKGVAIVPADPLQQLRMAIQAIFESWFNPRAMAYREMYGLSNKSGTAVTVQSMVYGNMNNISGAGVCFSHNPSTGERSFCGEFLFGHAGEDFECLKRRISGLDDLRKSLPTVYDNLFCIQKKLEGRFRCMQVGTSVQT